LKEVNQLRTNILLQTLLQIAAESRS